MPQLKHVKTIQDVFDMYEKHGNKDIFEDALISLKPANEYFSEMYKERK